MNKARVLITGISGHLGSHLANQALKMPNLVVRGILRNKEDPDRLENIKKAFGDNFYKMELFDSDLEFPETFQEAIKGKLFLKLNQIVIT